MTGPDQWDGRVLRVHKWTTDPRRVVPDGCVFITVKGAGVGTLFPGVRSAIGRDVYAFEPVRELSKEFVIRALELTMANIKRQAAGDIPGLSKDHILKHLIGLPPLTEQARMAAKIDDVLRRVNATYDRLAKVPEILKHFRKSVLAAASSGRLTEDWREGKTVGESAQALIARIEQGRGKAARKYADEGEFDNLPELPNHWEWAAMGRVADIQGGIQKQPKRAPKKHAYPYLRVANVLRDRLDLSEIKEMELFAGELETYGLRRNDLLIIEGNGSITEIGRCALWSGEIRDCVHQNHIIRVRARECLPEYLNIYWNSPIGIGRVKDVAVTTAGLYSLSTKKIATLPVPVGPLKEQQEIVRRVGVLFKLADKVEERVAASTKRVDKLTQAILAKAFRGELVPTEAELAEKEGRKYEPASVLLERIRTERQSESTRRRHP